MEISLLELQVSLAINALQSKAYAGSILDEFNKCTRQSQWHGTIYAALDRLEERGFVKRILESKPSPKRGGKRKYIWSLTTLGRMTLARTLRTIVPYLGATPRVVQPQRTRKIQSDLTSGITRSRSDLSLQHKVRHNRKNPRRTAPVGFFASKI
jgi:PadR family transcriptional regulator PadR